MDINVYINERNDFNNKFNNDELNSELGEYIFQKMLVASLKRKQSVKINVFTSFNVSQDENIAMIAMLKKYFLNQINLEKIYLNNSYIKNFLLSVAGMFLIAISYWLNNGTNFILTEILLIMGWLIIWEMGYSVLFSNSQHRLKIRLLKKITSCDVDVSSNK